MNKKEPTREDARQILKKGILDMSVARLIQLSQFGLMGNITLSNGIVSVSNAFNHIIFDEKDKTITFAVKETQMVDSCYGSISFMIDCITYISGCEDSDNPDEYLNININLEEGTIIHIRILY